VPANVTVGCAVGEADTTGAGCGAGVPAKVTAGEVDVVAG
jgi:hypothetical protein